MCRVGGASPPSQALLGLTQEAAAGEPAWDRQGEHSPGAPLEDSFLISLSLTSRAHCPLGAEWPSLCLGLAHSSSGAHSHVHPVPSATWAFPSSRPPAQAELCCGSHGNRAVMGGGGLCAVGGGEARAACDCSPLETRGPASSLHRLPSSTFFLPLSWFCRRVSYCSC